MIVGFSEGVIAFIRMTVTALAVFEGGAWIATAIKSARGEQAAGNAYLAVTICLLLAAVGGMAWRSHTATKVAVWSGILFVFAALGAAPLLSL